MQFMAPSSFYLSDIIIVASLSKYSLGQSILAPVPNLVTFFLKKPLIFFTLSSFCT